MTDLTAFLLARIAEDEAVARACAEAFPSPWDVVDRGHSATVKADAPNFWVVSAIDQEQETPGRWPGEHLEHIALHDPARVLAQCAAYKAIVEAVGKWKHEVVEDCWYTCAAATEERDGGECCDDNRRGTGCDCGLEFRARAILAPLASIWGDHPAYDTDWRLS